MSVSRLDPVHSSVQLPETSAPDGFGERKPVESTTVVQTMSLTVLDADGTDDRTVPRVTTVSPSVHASCVDLQGIYGPRFKIRQEANGVTWFETPESERVWMLEIPCKHGVVYPQGGDILAATITSRRIGNLVAMLPGIRSTTGDVERVVTFHVDDAEAVLDLLQPRRRRRISPEERERLVALGRVHGAAGLARAHQQRRQGSLDLSRALETGAKIDAATEIDLGPTPDLPDVGNQVGDGQLRSRHRAGGRRS